MHGCSSGSGLLVNAEVDSMGGVVDGGVGVGLKTSPRRAAIERAQAVLRQEYDVREERRRELEFLEKGGNPLDFKFGNAASVSVQSTSLTDQHPEQIVTSEAKGSFALAASPHGDSVESSGRPGVPAVCEPNSADNLLLFDVENELLEAERSSIQPSRRNNIAPSEQSSQMDGSQNAKESEDSAIVRPYARRNRSRHPIRDSARGRDGKGMMSETNNAKDQNIPSISNPKSASSNGDLVSKIVSSDNQLDTDLDGVRALGTTGRSLPEGKLDIKAPKNLRDNQHDQPSQVSSQQTAIDMASGVPDLVGERHQVVSAGFEHSPCATTTKDENETRSGQLNGFSSIKIDRKSILNEGQNSNAALGTKGLDPECSSTQASLGLDVNNDSDMCTNTRKVVSNGNTVEQTSNFEETINLAGGEVVKEKNESNGVEKKNDTKAIDKTNETKAVDSGPIIDARQDSVYQNHSGNGSVVEVEEDMHLNGSELQNEVIYPSNDEGVQQNEHTASETEGKVDDVLGDNSNPCKENFGTGGLQERMDISNHELPGAALSVMDSSAATEPQTCSGNSLKLADKAHEDSILEEARIIEAKHKRIAELSVRTLYLEHRRKSQWDFVLEEMAWLANDFAQERLWKINAAAQICYRAAFTSRLRFEQQNQFCELKRVARTLAKAVTQFWSSAEVLLNRDDPSVGLKNSKYSLVGSRSADGNEVSEEKIGESDMERSQEVGTQFPRKNPATAVLGYAVRFLKYNSSVVPLQAEAPSTPDRISDLGTVEMSWEDHLTEESLFYSVPSGAMETYRKCIESHLLQSEKTGSSMQEEVDTSTYDAVADYVYEENVYDEDEGETSTFSFPGAFEGSKSSKFAQKKRKSLMKSYTSRSYEVGADMPYCTTGNQQSMMIGKRPASVNVGSIPTKRMRTATRQRVLSPFSTGATGNMQAQVKTDASSGDTNSCQDDQSTLHGGSQIQKSVEVESVGDFEKQLPYDCAETSIKLKKKKKAKHLGSTYDLGWQMDSSILNEQRDHSRKRMEGHHFESNGTSGLYGQPNAKKPKIMKQSLDNTFDNITPMSGSIPSPVASQMSNMSNPNKFIKLIGGRDRGRKVKALKMSPGQSGSGSPWSLFEDQALVVLVHDMGPNWELVSDVINSTLQFKCIFRKPKECNERHKLLMDRNAGDGADSAEDSGSSQSYPSTLPGIPKGSARQLFQRLQGPMEEDTIKAHFEKIIMIGQKQHYRRSQSDNQDLKQIGAVHNSHAVAISQVSPNNLNGGVLMPLDLCDATTSSPDLPHGYQVSHASGLAISNQGAVASVLPTSGANSALQGSSSVVVSSNLSSPSAPLNASVRDGRYNVPRTSSLPVDEQQRLQQYNQMLSGRNIQQSSMSVPGALSGADRGVRMLPGANGMGMMCGMNRSMPISRPGFQGMASSSMLNSATMHSSGMVGMPSPVNMHSGPGSGQVNSMLRPRDTLHMMRPGHNPEHQRQMMVPELQMQVTQGNSQVMPHFSSAFSNQTTSPPIQPYAGHSQQQHQMSPQQSHALSSPHHPHIQGPSHATGSQQQAYAMRLAKGHLQQRYLQQQQQQPPFAASNALIPHVQPQPQHPISSSLQNSSQIQSQTSSQPVSLSPVTSSSPMTPLSSQHQQKHQLPQHGLSRNPGASGLTNQMGKQRQRQPQQQQFQQSGRHHPQQRQQAQSQQQAKLLKGIGRGNMLVQQNLPIDPSHLNGLSMPPGSQAPEKGEQIMHVMQGQGVYSGSGLNPVQPSKPLVPSQSSNHSQLQQKLHSGPAAPSSKQLQQMPTHSDNSTQGQSPSVASGHTLSSSHQTIPSANVASNHQQLQLQPQPQPHQKQVNQTQSSVQRMLQQNRQVNSELQNKSHTDLAQADQQAVNNASQVICSTAIPQACIDSADAVPVSSGTASPWKASEPAYDSNLPDLATQVSSVGSPPIANPAGSEPLPPISPGLGPRQLSGSFPSHGHNVGVQWQSQLPPQQPPTPPPPSQQQYQPQEQQKQEQSPQHIQPQQQSHQQTQLLQAGQGSLYMRPTSSKLE